jgi:arabinogalactan endo-1,4-beta-galactosidase
MAGLQAQVATRVSSAVVVVLTVSNTTAMEMVIAGGSTRPVPDPAHEGLSVVVQSMAATYQQAVTVVERAAGVTSNLHLCA